MDFQKLSNNIAYKMQQLDTIMSSQEENRLVCLDSNVETIKDNACKCDSRHLFNFGHEKICVDYKKF